MNGIIPPQADESRAAEVSVSALDRWRGVLISLRPRQWTKNLLVFAGLLFSGRMLQPEYWLPALIAFAAFCALSGAIYLLNDVVDREQDRRHPKKRNRPIAAGTVSPATAGFVSAGAAAAGLALAHWAHPSLFYLASAYVGLNLAYILGLKNVPLVELFSVAMGFVVRAMAGVMVVEAELSPWFLLCTVLLSLLLVLGKRRHELLLLVQGAGEHRPALDFYSRELLDQLLTVVTTATLVSYFLYTFFSPAGAEHLALMWTIIPVLYGLFRYLYLVLDAGQGGEPEDILLQDPGILGSVLLWLGGVIIALYWI